MNENRTAAILQRFAVILAVTAASYGLQAQAAGVGSNGNSQPQAQSAGPQRC